MRKLLKEFFNKNKDAKYEYVYFDQTTEELTEEWFGKAGKYKAQGLTHKMTEEQAMLTFDEAALSIGAKHNYPIQQTKADISRLKNELADLKERSSEYVESEKKTLSDEQFEHIDQLEAKLNMLQSQSDEHLQIISTSKNEDHEG